MMNYLDLFIIYLACGSPFGVYYFLNNRKQNELAWLTSIAVVFVWIPYAFRLLHEKVTSKLQTDTELQNFVKINKLQKEFENFLPDGNKIISLFELREVIERYSELTQINSVANGNPANHEKEIFKINNNKNLEISALCLNRRNRQRLFLHQNLAREDFLKTLGILLKQSSEQKKLGELALEFVRILNDEVAETSLNNLFSRSKQTFKTSSVNDLEKELWKPEQLEQSNATQLSMPLQTLTATAINGRKKD